MADALNLSVIAEGVETVEQLDVLRGLRAGYGQGFLWAKPIKAAELPSWVAARAQREGEHS